MVDVYPVVQPPPVLATTLTTSVVVNANSTYFIKVQQPPYYRNNVLFFQAQGPVGTIYIYLYYSPDGVNYDTVPQATITISMTSTIFNYSWIFPTPVPYAQYGISPTGTITLNYLGVIYF